MKTTRGKAATASALVLASAGLLGSMAGGAATAAGPVSGDPTTLLTQGTETKAKLHALNNSGVTGTSKVTVDGRQLDISVDARGLLRDMPHAQHIHFGQKADNECPTVRADDNGDHRLNTAEGQPDYGAIRVSLTENGPTGAKSGLAVDRFPTAPDGEIHYDRNTDTRERVARGIARGEAVVVVHGIDYNQNRKYDFDGAGRSELLPTVPAEATDPVSCGVLKPVQPLPSPPSG